MLDLSLYKRHTVRIIRQNPVGEQGGGAYHAGYRDEEVLDVTGCLAPMSPASVMEAYGLDLKQPVGFLTKRENYDYLRQGDELYYLDARYIVRAISEPITNSAIPSLNVITVILERVDDAC